MKARFSKITRAVVSNAHYDHNTGFIETTNQLERLTWSNAAMGSANIFRHLWPAQLRTNRHLLGCEFRCLFYFIRFCFCLRWKSVTTHFLSSKMYTFDQLPARGVWNLAYLTFSRTKFIRKHWIEEINSNIWIWYTFKKFPRLIHESWIFWSFAQMPPKVSWKSLSEMVVVRIICLWKQPISTKIFCQFRSCSFLWKSLTNACCTGTPLFFNVIWNTERFLY